jgi:carbon-monoxide dehydrogenase medium subunit
MVPSLIVLKARVRTEGPNGGREIETEDLFAGPGVTTLGAGELIVSFLAPEGSPRSGSTYVKLGRREGADCALVGVAVSLTLSGSGKGLREAGVALSSVAPVPLRARKAEKVLLSGPFTPGCLKEASAAAAEEASPIDDIRATRSYRKEMVRVLTYRALLKALAIAEGRSAAN